jgi:uncharacterized protein YkwD
MRSRRATALAVGLTTLASTAPASAEAAPAPSRHDSVERSVIAKLNWIRGSGGVRGLRASRRLARAADAKSRTVAAGGAFSNGNMAARLRRFVRARTIGETLAWVLPSQGDEATAVVNAWMASPSHRATLLSTRFARIGVARRRGSLRGTFATVYTVNVASAR